MFAKKCTSPGCDRTFTMTGKPHKDATAICPGCSQEVKIGDAREIPEQPAAKPTTTEEGK